MHESIQNRSSRFSNIFALSSRNCKYIEHVCTKEPAASIVCIGMLLANYLLIDYNLHSN